MHGSRSWKQELSRIWRPRWADLSLSQRHSQERRKRLSLGVCVQLCAHRGQESTLHVFFYYLYFIVLRQSLLLNSEFPFQLNSLISKPPEFVPLPSAVLQHHCAKPLCGYLGPKVKFSNLHRKHFIQEAISPAPWEKILRYMFGNIVWSSKESLCFNFCPCQGVPAPQPNSYGWNHRRSPGLQASLPVAQTDPPREVGKEVFFSFV